MAHAGAAGRRGAVKVAFDLRPGRHRSTDQRKDASDEPQARLRPRGRPLDPAHPVLARRGLPPRAAARGEPGDLRPRAARRARRPGGRHPPRPRRTRWATPSRCRPCCARACGSPSASTTSRCPLPPMQAPDIRQLVIEQVLDMAAAAGVDDVVLIAALALHRRMTEAELRHALGDRVYDAFAPHGLLTQHDAEDPDNLDPPRARPTRARTSRSTSGRPPATCWSTSTSTWWPWTAATRAWPPGWPATRACATTTTRSTMRHSRSFMDAPASELHTSNWRMGRLIAERRGEGLPDRDHPQHRHLPLAVRLPAEAGVGVERCATGPPSPPRSAALDAHAGPAGPPDLPLHPGRPTP